MCRAGQGQRHYAMVLTKNISAANLNGECRWLGTNGFAIVQTLGPPSCPFPPVCNFTPSNEVKRYSRQEAGGQGRPTTSKVNTTQTISDSCTAQAHFCADSLPLSPTPSQQIRNHHLHFALSPVLSNSHIVKFYQTHPRASGLGTLTNVYPVFQILTAGLWQTFQSVR